MTKRWSVVALLIISGVIFIIATAGGAVRIPWTAFLFQEEGVYTSILWQIRMPRVVLAALIGGALAISGVVMQSLLQNPLADPFTLGVSSGATVGATVAIAFSLSFLGSWTIVGFAALGALFAMLFVLVLTRFIDTQMRMETLLLVGVMMGAFLSAITSLILLFSPDETRPILFWLMGSVSMKGWSAVVVVAPIILILSLYISSQARALNAFSLGEQEAHIVGVDVKRFKRNMFVVVSLLVGSAVAFSGMIGFVGLIVPHVTRLFVGFHHKYVLPLSFLNGASFLMLADWIGRTVLAPTELPLGVMTSLIGVPIFLIVYIRLRKEAYDA